MDLDEAIQYANENLCADVSFCFGESFHMDLFRVDRGTVVVENRINYFYIMKNDFLHIVCEFLKNKFDRIDCFYSAGVNWKFYRK